MKVILQKDVPNLGDAGEIKQVAAGYARNYLLPKKLVVLAKAGSTKALEHQKRLMAIKAKKRIAEMEGLAEKLKALDALEIEARVGANGKMFGSVTAITIAQALLEKGFPIDKRKIDLPDKIKSPGEYNVPVRLAEKISVTLNVQVVPVEEKEEEHEDEFAEEARLNALAEERAKERAAAKAAAQKESDSEDTEAKAEEDSEESAAKETAPDASSAE